MSGPDRDDEEPRAKDVIAARRTDAAPRPVTPRPGDDLATRAKLARWFGAGDPSGAFAARGLPDDDDDDGIEGDGDAPNVGEAPAAAANDSDAARIRRAALLAAVDPALLARLEARAVLDISSMSRLPPLPLVLRDLSRLDPQLMARADAIADPREVEVSEELRNDLRDCAPQALLRDLERPIFEFSIEFERGLAHEAASLDAGAAARRVMTTRLRPAPPSLIGRELAAHADDMRAMRRAPWADLPKTVPMAYRREDVT